LNPVLVLSSHVPGDGGGGEGVGGGDRTGGGKDIGLSVPQMVNPPKVTVASAYQRNVSPEPITTFAGPSTPLKRRPRIWM